MKWYYHIAGGHTHVRVFMNGAKCGDLCFRNEEFAIVRAFVHADFIEEPSSSERQSALHDGHI